jgi:hypothetical protein
MASKKTIDLSIVPVERIEGAILLIRGEKVMLDRDLARLYGVETRTLVQAVKRNIDRFRMISCSSSTRRSLRIGGHKL